jgi:hypothetical protein
MTLPYKIIFMTNYQQQALELFESITIEPIQDSSHYRLKMKPKKWKEKWYRCKNESDAIFYRQKFLDEKARILENKANYIETRKKEIEQNIKDIQVWTILYHSRWYDQTNIDFYQVTKKKNRMLELTPIKEECKGWGYEYGTKLPLKDQFCGEPMKKIITIHWISMQYWCMVQWQEGKEVHYSWGRIKL